MKYELTYETKVVDGHTLHRIRAVQDMPLHNVKAGDLGGWVEIEKMNVRGVKVSTLVKRLNLKHIKGYFYAYDYAIIRMGRRRIEVASELLMNAARLLGGNVELCVVGSDGRYLKVDGRSVMKITDPLSSFVDRVISE